MLKSGLRPYPPYLFVTASVSTTLEHEVGDHTDSVRFVISSDSSYHSGANVAEAEVDYLVRSSAHIMTTVTTVTVLRVLEVSSLQLYASVQKLKKALGGVSLAWLTNSKSERCLSLIRS
ncbi:hypothetical protein Tco_0778581 [Tanacetum coccineum]